MIIKSPAFKNGEPIPRKYSHKAENLSPPLEFLNVPTEAKSLALIVDDPDAPLGTFDHWIIWNIPAFVKEVPEGAHALVTSHPKTKEGLNHYGNQRYDGPAPPPGKVHHYYFKLFALNSELNLKAGSTKEDLLKAMQGHVIDHSELIGTFQHESLIEMR